MSSTVPATNSPTVKRKPTASAFSKIFQKVNVNEAIKEILVKNVDIKKFKTEIENLRSKSWSNFQIAHCYVSLVDPDNPQGHNVKKGPNLGGFVNTAIEKSKQAFKLKEQLEEPIKAICSIALTYDASITSKKELYIPILRTLLYSVSQENARQVSLLEKSPPQIAEIAKKSLPKIEKKVSAELLETGAVVVAGMIPGVGGYFRKDYVDSYKIQRTVDDIRNMVDLIDDYEAIVSTPDLESIKKKMISSKMFNHLSVDQTGWYNNRYIQFLLTLSIPVFFPMLLLLVIALWLNQTRSQNWMWYTDKRLVIANLIFILPIGLYGVYKGKLFNYGPKWFDNRAYLIVLMFLLLPPVITSPVALYAIVRTRAMGIAGKIITFLLFSGYVSLIFLATQLPSS
jgi:hypothetical protein